MDATVVLQILATAFASVVGWAYIKFTVAQHSKEIQDIRNDYRNMSSDFTSRINAAFRRIDQSSDRILTLETNSYRYITREDAKDELVSLKEMDLQLRILKKSMDHLECDIEKTVIKDNKNGNTQ